MIKGKVIYDGQSLMDRTEIIVIASWDQDNPKTGHMVQTRIMNKNNPPNVAVLDGTDSAVCGACPRRPFLSGLTDLEPCYVQTDGSPRRDWDAYWWKEILNDDMPDIPIRLGSYGDPAMVPVKVWEDLITEHNQRWTGYTHQWKECPEYKHLCMASCDSIAETSEALALGWRTYSAFNEQEYHLSTLASCPAVDGTGKNCVDCMACHGSHTTKASIKILEHASWKK